MTEPNITDKALPLSEVLDGIADVSDEDMGRIIQQWESDDPEVAALLDAEPIED